MTTHSFFRWLGRSLIPNIGTLVIVALMLAYQQATAQTGATPSSPPLVTNTFAYQGFLTNNTGQPINGNRALTFRLYDVANGGTALWTEVRNTVSVENGLFYVRLGEIVPIPASVWHTPNLYLGIQVEAESELLPREAIGLVPVAQRAITADLALTVPDASVTSEKLNPTLTFVPAPDDVVTLSSTFTPLFTTTINVNVPSRIWFVHTFDVSITQGGLEGWTLIDGVFQDHHVVLSSEGPSAQTVRSVSSSMHIAELAPGSHEIVMGANTIGGSGQFFGHNSGLTYMIVSQ